MTGVQTCALPIYLGPVYSEAELDDALCPWCIANGAAHAKFDAAFVDAEAFSDGVPPILVDEICTRTPGFNAWQTPRWLTVDAMPAEFVEPAGIAEIRSRYPSLEGTLMSFIVHDLGISGGAAVRMLEALRRDQCPTAYVFYDRAHDQHLGYVDFL